MSSLLLIFLNALAPIFSFVVNRIIKSADAKEKAAEEELSKEKYFKDFCARSLKYVTQVDLEYVKNTNETAYTSLNEANAKEKAKELLKNSYGLDGLTQLALFFNTDAKGLERTIDLQIEASIMELKN